MLNNLLNPLVSVIVPAYNAEKFIEDTIHSVLNQTYTNWELIIINDGSTDNTANILNNFIQERINIVHQENKGVSFARNYGLKLSKGDFIVFLDADDILSNNFIEKRINTLLSNESIGFCCSDVLHFINSTDKIVKKNRGIAEQIEENVLLYRQGFDTVPSNYIYRKSILVCNNIQFETSLSSTADRYFLLQVSKVTQGVYIENAPIYYRIIKNSMSNQFSKKLVYDNILYFKLLNKSKIIPEHLKKEVYIIHAYILGTACLKLRSISFFKWYLIGFYTSPLRFFKHFFKKTLK